MAFLPPPMTLFLLVAPMAAAALAGRDGCGARGLCCQGRNNTCRSSSTMGLDHIGVGGPQEDGGGQGKGGAAAAPAPGEVKTCFCDSACLELGDCCDDYGRFCRPVDCAVSAKWSDWGACSALCGPGVKQRTRRVVRPALNGGRSCNRTVEKIACEGARCKMARAPERLEQLAEIGKIIPASYGRWRKNKLYDPFSDIRRNLFHRYRSADVVSRPSYCVKFKITEATSACNATTTDHQRPDDTGPSKGLDVCVECQTTAMQKQLGGRCHGQGVLLRETRWNAVLKPGCQGRWMMQSRQEDCQCDLQDGRKSFILL